MPPQPSRCPASTLFLLPDEVNGIRLGKRLIDEPLLAYDSARYIGDKIAAIAAEDEDIAEQAIALIDVEYEELPAAVTMDEALAQDAPILHPDFNSYEGIPGPHGNPVQHLRQGNVGQGRRL